MVNTLNTQDNSLLNKYHKDTRKRFYQREIILKAFHKVSTTMLMVTHQTGVKLTNIYRYVTESGKENRINIAERQFNKGATTYLQNIR